MATPQTLPRPQRAAPAELDTAPATRERPRFPGWRWMAVCARLPGRRVHRMEGRRTR